LGEAEDLSASVFVEYAPGNFEPFSMKCGAKYTLNRKKPPPARRTAAIRYAMGFAADRGARILAPQ
jgi:hypothetical protein